MNAPETLYRELSGFLLKATPEELMDKGAFLGRVIPELAATLGFQQHSPHHAYDVFTHTAHVTGMLPHQLPLRWAGLLHDIGKVPCFVLDENGRGHFKNHALVSARMADQVLGRLEAPEPDRTLTVWLIRNHMTVLQPEPEVLRPLLERWGRERLELLLSLQEADMKGKGTREHENSQRYPRLRQLLAEMDTKR